MTGKEGATIELTEDQRRALREGEGSPPVVVDPETQVSYVLVRKDLYDRLHGLLEEDWPAEERLWLLAESGRRAGWDEPEMDAYDHYDESRKKRCR
jgi:hypothetical protein